MTKMIKMSLIAAVAVTGMTSTVCAQPLEDAIKGVDFSGNLRYRYTGGAVNTDATNNYRLEFAVKSKVNDMVTANVASSINASTTDRTTSGTAVAAGDADPTAAVVKEANFAFNVNGNTIIAGKQGLATPFASGTLEDQQGTGVVALVPVAGVTVAAGLYLNSDAKSNETANGVATVNLSGNNIAALAVIGKASVVNYAAWYAKISENQVTTDGVTAGASAVNLNVKAPVGPVDVELNYAKVDYKSANNATIDAQSPTQSRIVVSGKISDITLAAGVVMAGKDGGDVTLGDNDAAANFGTMEYFTGDKLKDTKAYYVAAFAPVGPVKVGVEYGTTSAINGSATTEQKLNELKVSAAYAMSKNFTVSAYVTNDRSDNATADKMDERRIEIKYTF